MSLHVETETIMGHGGQPVDESVRDRLRKRMAAMLDSAGVAAADKQDSLEELEKLLTSASGQTLDSLSAESIAVGLDKAADSLSPLDTGMVALGFSLSQRGKGKQSFEMGETRGMLMAARGILSVAASNISVAASNIRHAVACDCHAPKEESESETIPPPAPGPEEAA